MTGAVAIKQPSNIGGGAVSQPQAESLGLTKAEFAHICQALGRPPNLCEAGIFAAMWSEHCSYKSSKHLLKTLPSAGPAVIAGAGDGENAGAVDIGDGLAAVFKIESHNHPSFISPYQGAATGVGGILRDIFTMGARPVAVLNSLHFGAADHPLTRHFTSQVVAGIGGYGNAIGIPTIGGESHFSADYNNNILVNAMAVGIVPQGKIFRAKAEGVGNLVVYMGAKTGQDGIHGASMASAEFSDSNDSDSKRPTVQVGDPLAGKLVMDATLDLMGRGLVLAAQDMGAAGLTSSSVEMAAKGGVGIRLDLDALPCRAENMTAFDMMLSESQERMLLIVAPQAWDKVAHCLASWGVDCVIIGEVTDSQRLVVSHGGSTAADLPIDLLANGCPPAPIPEVTAATKPATPSNKTSSKPATSDLSLTEALRCMLASHHLASREWIYQQYDRHVMGDTVLAGMGDGAVVRVHGSRRGLAITTDCTHRYVAADAYLGTMLAVAEAQRNISATGATPVAVTNNLNFGNPHKPAIMQQLADAVAGLGDACRAFGLPVVSGNVSLHNETDGIAIAPTPVIGMLGVMADVATATAIAIQQVGLTLYIVGQARDASDGWLANSVWAEVIAGAGNPATQPPPPVNLKAEAKHSQFVRQLIQAKLVHAAHDISDGGALVALAEMLLASKNKSIGAKLALPATCLNHNWAFGEDQARFIIATASPKLVVKKATRDHIPLQEIGITTNDNRLTCDSDDAIVMDELAAGYRNWLPQLTE